MNLKNRLVAATGAVLLAMTLAGCGNGSGVAGPTVTAERTEKVTPGPGGEAVEPAHNKADIQFAQMMIIHHEGAIEMADLAVEKAASEDLRSLAKGISAAQGPEIAQMRSWLGTWGEDTTGVQHDGMDHAGMDMDGMSQADAMEQLRGLSGTEFDRRFLELMTAHHEGAVIMAEKERTDGENPQARNLAQKIIDDQRAEIAKMEQMLRTL